MKIVETDNFNGDYPMEKFLNLPPMPDDKAQRIATFINDTINTDGYYPRFWKAVEDNYALDDKPFEP